MRKIQQYVKESIQELKKVTWPMAYLGRTQGIHSRGDAL